MITLRATVDFKLRGEIAIPKGSLRTLPNPRANGNRFATTTRWGTRYPSLCTINQGWEIITDKSRTL